MGQRFGQSVADALVVRWPSRPRPERGRRAPAVIASRQVSDAVAAMPAPVVDGSDVTHAMLQTNPASSRAIAMMMTGFGFPLAIIWR